MGRKRIVIFIMTLALSLILGAAIGAVRIDDPWKEAQEKSFFALNGTKVFHIPNELETTVARRIELMKQLGVMWDRSDWWWHVIEPQKGRFDFSTPDKIVKFFEERRIQIYPILCYGAAWWKDRNAPLNDDEFEMFGNYVYETVKRYKGHFTYWSVWNEPNILPFWAPEPNADHYARLLKVAYKAAKRADPDCKVCAPVIAPLGEWDKKFVGRLYQLGCKDYFDIFDYHYYRNAPPEKEVPAEIADIRAFMRRWGDEKPIWISESGVSGMIENKPESYHRQAALVVRNQLLCLACGVKRFFYFDLQNWNDSPAETWDSKLGLVEAGWEPKMAFHAYRTMVKEVDFKRAVGRISHPAEEFESVLFFDEKLAEWILAAWLNREDNLKKTIEFVCKSEDVKIVHPYGETEVRPLENPPAPGMRTRRVAIEIDRQPRFIHSVDSLTYLPEAGIRLEPEKIYMNAGEKKSLKLAMDPLLGKTEVRILRVGVPKGITWDTTKGELASEEGIPAGRHEITVSAEVRCTDGRTTQTARIERKSEIEILPVITLNLRPYLGGQNLIIQATILNQSPLSLKGAIHLEDAGAPTPVKLASTEPVTIKAGETSRVDIPLERRILEGYTQPTAWSLKFCEYESKPFQVYVAPLREKSPIVDGNLDEWGDVPAMFIGRKEQIVRGAEGWTPAEASGRVYLWFTKDTVFIAARVTDDDPVYNPHPDKLIWKGDMIELYLGFGGPARRTVLNKEVDFQLGIAPTYEKNQPIAFLFHADRIITDAKVAFKKIPEGYTIEASIPLKEFGRVELANGMLIGLDAAVNNLDRGDWAPAGNEPGRALMWNGTGTNWIDPTGWGMAILRGD